MIVSAVSDTARLPTPRGPEEPFRHTVYSSEAVTLPGGTPPWQSKLVPPPGSHGWDLVPLGIAFAIPPTLHATFEPLPVAHTGARSSAPPPPLRGVLQQVRQGVATIYPNDRLQPQYLALRNNGPNDVDIHPGTPSAS